MTVTLRGTVVGRMSKKSNCPQVSLNHFSCPSQASYFIVNGLSYRGRREIMNGAFSNYFWMFFHMTFNTDIIRFKFVHHKQLSEKSGLRIRKKSQTYWDVLAGDWNKEGSQINLEATYLTLVQDATHQFLSQSNVQLKREQFPAIHINDASEGSYLGQLSEKCLLRRGRGNSHCNQTRKTAWTMNFVLMGRPVGSP